MRDDLRYERFNPTRHYLDLLLLLTLRGMIVRPEELPKAGWIAYSGITPIAAGFVRRVEGHVGWLDSFVTHPGKSSELRHIAYDGVYRCALKYARRYKLNRLCALSVDNGTLERAKRHGFIEMPQRLVSLTLEERPK